MCAVHQVVAMNAVVGTHLERGVLAAERHLDAIEEAVEALVGLDLRPPGAREGRRRVHRDDPHPLPARPRGAARG